MPFIQLHCVTELVLILRKSEVLCSLIKRKDPLSHIDHMCFGMKDSREMAKYIQYNPLMQALNTVCHV